MGFEPTASSMRPKRSSQLSYTPEGRPAYRRGVTASEPLSVTRNPLVSTQSERKFT